MNLAIKGHLTRGKEVIEILEMLGGINLRRLDGTDHNFCYTIDNDGNILGINTYLCNHVHDTLEEFLEKYPYKVGDKVQHKGATSCGTVYEIEQMIWEDNQIKYIICDLCWKNIKYTGTTENLRPYKKETMEDNIIDVVKENDNRYRIILNYQYDMEVDEGEYYAVRRKPQYPKTYEECCKVLGYEPDEDEINCYQGQLIESFVKLLICRDAYWLLAGEQMGLGKPWKPDWNNGDQERYGIIKLDDNGYQYAESTSFVFPTEEMRDAFFENFKDLIELCKELL